MADPDKRLQTLLYGAIMSTLAATVTAMLSPEKNIWTKVKTFIAGVTAGILLHLIFMNFDFGQGYKDVFATATAAFISTIWPMLGTLSKRYLKAYGDKKIKEEQDDSV